MPSHAGHIPPQLRTRWKRRDTPIHPLVERYKREYIDYHQLTHQEWDNRRRILHVFGEMLDGRDITEMTGADLQAYGGARLQAGRHVNTVRFEMNRIRWFASWLYANRLMDPNQLLEIRAIRNPRGSTGKAIPRPYNREALDRFYATVDARWPLIATTPKRTNGLLNLNVRSVDRWVATGQGWLYVRRHAVHLQIEAITALALHCALRANEIYTLPLRQLTANPAFLVVKAKRSDNREKTREVPFTAPARDAVERWLDCRYKLSPRHKQPWMRLSNSSSGNDPMTKHNFYTFLTRTVGPEWHLHRFRHTAATERLRAGADIEIVQQWLGHSSIQMTLGYLEIVREDVAKGMAATEADFQQRVMRHTGGGEENGDTNVQERAA